MEFLSCIYRFAIGLLNFLEKEKKSLWVAWTAYSSAAVAFKYAFQDLFMKVDKNYMCFKLIERFTWVIYDKTTSITNVNDFRQDLFLKQAKLINSSLPPTQVSLVVHALFLLDEFYLLLCFLPGTQDAYIEHTNGALFQASIWATYLKKNQNIPLPEGFGWTQEEDWKPV